MLQVRKTLWALLADRGYEVHDVDRNASVGEFKEKCTDDGMINDANKLTMRVHKVRLVHESNASACFTA